MISNYLVADDLANDPEIRGALIYKRQLREERPPCNPASLSQLQLIIYSLLNIYSPCLCRAAVWEMREGPCSGRVWLWGCRGSAGGFGVTLFPIPQGRRN